MGEIKSTLDIVMEKTKGLMLSEKERVDQKAEDIRKTLRGFIQKCRDGHIREDQYDHEFRAIEKTEIQTNEAILRSEILDQITLHEDASVLLHLLQTICGKPIDPLRRVLAKFAEKREDLLKSRLRTDKELLSEKYAISGSAVVPNRETDTEWPKVLGDLTETFERRLAEEKTLLQGN